MNEFPKLKSGAISQYPVTRTAQHVTWVGRFVDGAEQRFRQSRGVKRQWILDLRLLSEDEIGLIRSFFEEIGGRAGVFSFEDPFDSATYPRCRFGADEIEIVWEFEGQGRTRLLIVEEGA